MCHEIKSDYKCPRRLFASKPPETKNHECRNGAVDEPAFAPAKQTLDPGGLRPKEALLAVGPNQEVAGAQLPVKQLRDADRQGQRDGPEKAFCVQKSLRKAAVKGEEPRNGQGNEEVGWANEHKESGQKPQKEQPPRLFAPAPQIAMVEHHGREHKGCPVAHGAAVGAVVKEVTA